VVFENEIKTVYSADKIIFREMIVVVKFEAGHLLIP
jgi:hypothetical protein